MGKPDIRERFWTWWFDGIPQPVADRLFDRVVSEAARDQLGALVDECRELTSRLALARSARDIHLAELGIARGRLGAALDEIRELTRQRDDARDLAVRSGIFESDGSMP